MDLLEESGIVSYVGKVNMDRNGGENLCEADASAAAEDTKKWIEETAGKYERTNPILTPRFIPSCTDELMRELAKLQKNDRTPRAVASVGKPIGSRMGKRACPGSEKLCRCLRCF